uniref:Transposase n=1 Tax=Haemonchus placei TaxID=6290 RepID=A0A0N4WSZ9_HAEPC
MIELRFWGHLYIVITLMNEHGQADRNLSSDVLSIREISNHKIQTIRADARKLARCCRGKLLGLK